MKDNIREFPQQDHKSHNLSTEQPQHQSSGPYSFRCADVGQKCDWQVDGRSAEEVLQRVEEHGREAHNMRNISEQMRYKIRNHIRLAA
jgi:predicted small metal-binding protein